MIIKEEKISVIKHGVDTDLFCPSYDEKCRFVVADAKQPSKKDVVNTLKKSGAEMLLNYLPLPGSSLSYTFLWKCNRRRII